MDYEDRQLTCTDCGAQFIFSGGEQKFFEQRNLQNIPKRCPNCRLSLRFARNGKDVSQLCEAICADCTRPTKLPFRPRGHRPVYCNDCLARHKQPPREEAVVS